MKEWMVLDPNTKGVFITFPQSEEHEAREWMREHDHYIKQEGSPLHGAALELVEFETREERIKKALKASQEALISMHADPAWMRVQVEAGKCIECAEAIERVEPHLGRYYRALHTNHELLSR